MSGMVSDFGDAMIRLWRDRLVLLPALVVLSLGVSISTTAFSLVQGILLRPLPYHEPERLVMLWRLSQHGSKSWNNLKAFDQWSQHREIFEDVAFIKDASKDIQFDLTAVPIPVRIHGARVSLNFFPLVGVHAAAGRLFSYDDLALVDSGVVITDGLWKRVFNADPRVVGEMLTLNRRPYTVVGVLPPSFRLDNDPRLWNSPDVGRDIELFVPLPPRSVGSSPGEVAYRIIARLKKNVSVRAAQDFLESRADLSGVERDRPLVIALRDEVAGAARPQLLMFFSAASLVFVLGCLNVAGLLLARGIRREREVAVRECLGASKWRLMQGCLSEALFFGLVSGLVAVLIGTWSARAVSGWMPATTPRLGEVGIDSTIVFFCVLISGLAGVLASVGSLVVVGQRNLVTRLHSGGGTSFGSGLSRIWKGS